MFYSPLSGTSQIRVLTILPSFGRESARLEAMLEPTDLHIKPRPQYRALSYVWGDPKDVSTILCNGEEISITRSLSLALHQLRRDRQHYVIWIDQLCINQNDLDERAQQVTMMGDIYSWAEEVIVWLGLPDDETALVWRTLLELGKLREFEAHEIFDLALDSRPIAKDSDTVDQTPSSAVESTKGALKERLNLPPGSSPDWKAVNRFFQRAWFTRTWTFQEVLLSQSCTIICGKWSLPWIDLSDAVHAIHIAGFDKHMDSTHKGVADVQVGRIGLQKGQRSALRALLEANRYRSATEPRDKIYALRAAVRDSVAENIVVDYGERLGETYAKAVMSCIEESQALTVLGSVEYRRTEDSKHEMPSWVPDWRYRTSVAADLSMRRRDGSRVFDASNGKGAIITRESDPRKLRLKGIIVARLKRFSEVRRRLEFGVYRLGARRFPVDRFQLDKWQALYRTAVGNVTFPISSLKAPEQADKIMASIWGKSVNDPLTEAQTVEMAYRRTITADLYPRPTSRLNKRESNEGFPAYTSWQHLGFPHPVPMEVLHEHDFHVAQVMFNREFFIAENGADSFMGIAMGVPCDGDCVCVLFGGDTPFVLRSKDNGEWRMAIYSRGVCAWHHGRRSSGSSRQTRPRSGRNCTGVIQQRLLISESLGALIFIFPPESKSCGHSR